MLTVMHRMEHKVSNEGARESTQGAEGVCSPTGGTTRSTNQYPQSSQGLNQRVRMEGLKASTAYVAEDGLVGHQWEERPLVLLRLYALV